MDSFLRFSRINSKPDSHPETLLGLKHQRVVVLVCKRHRLVWSPMDVTEKKLVGMKDKISNDDFTTIGFSTPTFVYTKIFMLARFSLKIGSFNLR